MPVKDPERRKQIAREWYHRKRVQDPEYGKEKNIRRKLRMENDPEYKEKVNKQAREKRRELALDSEWRSTRNDRRRSLYEKNHAAYLLKAARYRAKKAGIEFSIIVEDITIPDLCPILGIPLEKGNGRPTDNSPNIDRIDCTKGYIKGNVWVISHRANRIKNDASLEELEKIVAALRNLQY
jgi:hypothetical protein